MLLTTLTQQHKRTQQTRTQQSVIGQPHNLVQSAQLQEPVIFGTIQKMSGRQMLVAAILVMT